MARRSNSKEEKYMADKVQQAKQASTMEAGCYRRCCPSSRQGNSSSSSQCATSVYVAGCMQRQPCSAPMRRCTAPKTRAGTRALAPQTVRDAGVVFFHPNPRPGGNLGQENSDRLVGRHRTATHFCHHAAGYVWGGALYRHQGRASHGVCPAE